MKLRYTLLFAFLLLIGSGVVLAQTPVDSLHSHIAATAEVADHAAAHGGEGGGIGQVLVDLLVEHFVDGDEFSLFGYTVHLPDVHIGSMALVTKHQVWWVIACLWTLLFAWIAGRQKTEVPTGLRNAFEAVAVFIRDEILRPNLHGRADAFLPFFLTLFTSIFISNCLGLMPWGSTATANVNVTAGLSICSLGLMVGMGVKEQGLMAFLHEFAPPGVPGWMLPLMVVVEIVSFFVKPFALTIRLFANMLAGHAVLAVMFGLIVSPLFAVPSIAVATFVTLLEVLVALIQAYIFIMLTAVFMGLTMHPAH
jgi:F-type H+-transporting ATPase subunit a